MLNLKDLPEFNTTILYTSTYNYLQDAEYFTLNKCNVILKDSPFNINDLPLSLAQDFNCEDLLTKENLTFIDKLKINILTTLTNKEKTYVFFNVLTYLDNPFKLKLIKYLKDNQKRIINYTLDIEETLLFDYIIVIHDQKIIMEGPTKDILTEEKILKKLGFNLPFVVELSNGLKYYGLIPEIYFDNESLVQALWK